MTTCDEARKAPPVGLEFNLVALVLRGVWTVDTLGNETVAAIETIAFATGMATAWQRQGHCVAHAVSDLCRMTSLLLAQQ